MYMQTVIVTQSNYSVQINSVKTEKYTMYQQWNATFRRFEWFKSFHADEWSSLFYEKENLANNV